MQRLRFAAAAALGTLTLPVAALAQQLPDLNQNYQGYNHMWQGNWGWHGGFMFYPAGMLLTWLGILFLVVLVVRLIMRAFGMGHHCGMSPQGQASSALELLENRFARGEIDKAEFEEKRLTLTRRRR